MALDPSFVGKAYPPTEPYEVSRVKIAEFAAAIGDDHPAYRDRDAALALGYPDVIAPPTFPITVSMQAAAQIIADPQLGLDYGRVVHGEQSFHYSRPVRAGDLLTVVVVVESIRTAAGNDIITTRGDVSTVDGEHVVTARSTLVSRAPDPAGSS